MRGRRASPSRADVASVADAGDDERHPGGLVVEVEPLLVQPAVGAEQLAVVGGAHQHRVVGAAFGDGAADPVDRRVDLGVQPVVEVAVALRVALVGPADGRRRAVAGVVGLAERDLRGRLGRRSSSAVGAAGTGGGSRGEARTGCAAPTPGTARCRAG